MTVPARASAFARCDLASVDAATASASAREITGLAVPFGPVGYSSAGEITFEQGSIRWDGANLGRIKLLRQHDQSSAAIGYASAVSESPEGLTMTFAIPEGPDGDAALAEAADGRRDGLSVGVHLDPEVQAEIFDKWWEDDTSPTAAAGELVEVSQVTMPAFTDARTDGSAAATPQLAAASRKGLTRMAVSFARPQTTVAAVTATEEITMPAQTTVEVTAPAAADEATTAAPAPAVVAGAAAAQVSDPAVYTFDGNGASFCRDVFHARAGFDQTARAAADRLDRFSAAMLGSSPAQLGALATAAVETRVTAPNYIQQGYKPELLLTVIDRGRPLNSRISSVNLADATPYRLPIEGEFTGVGDHVEGTAHIAEGDLTMSDMVITPGAISGAFRLSRELIDASNPALDQVAIRAMSRNYQAQTEAKLVAALLAADNVAAFNVDKVLEVSDAINDFYDVTGEDPSFIASSTSFYKTLRADVDLQGRPQLASINPVNAIGTRGSGSTGAHVDGVEIIKAATIATNDAFLVQAADVHVGESSLLTFRFDEVEGPGVIKLALWAYYVAKVLRPASVVQISSAAA